MSNQQHQSKSPCILVTGALGQIGTELTRALRDIYGKECVVATDIRHPDAGLLAEGPYYRLDILQKRDLEKIVEAHQVTQIYHLVAMLSATGEMNPLAGWDLNMISLLNVLEVARNYRLNKVFWPSSIAVFGPGAPKINCPQYGVIDPVTAYGISKSAGEQWCMYYRDHYALDVRSLRYPGLISHMALPGGGTTDFAVSIFHEALANGHYKCFLSADTRLPMMYMPDAIRATLQLMTADRSRLTVNGAYNISGLSFTPSELAEAISVHLPGFKIIYQPDSRQRIADSWPRTIDDEQARRDWSWQPVHNLPAIASDMILHLQARYR